MSSGDEEVKVPGRTQATWSGPLRGGSICALIAAGAIAIALGGTIRDIVSTLASGGLLGPALTGPSAGYSVVYHIEILLLFVTLVAVGPLVRRTSGMAERTTGKFGMASFPG